MPKVQEYDSHVPYGVQNDFVVLRYVRLRFAVRTGKLSYAQLRRPNPNLHSSRSVAVLLRELRLRFFTVQRAMGCAQSDGPASAPLGIDLPKTLLMPSVLVPRWIGFRVRAESSRSGGGDFTFRTSQGV